MMKPIHDFKLAGPPICCCQCGKWIILLPTMNGDYPLCVECESALESDNVNGVCLECGNPVPTGESQCYPCWQYETDMIERDERK